MPNAPRRPSPLGASKPITSARRPSMPRFALIALATRFGAAPVVAMGAGSSTRSTGLGAGSTDDFGSVARFVLRLARIVAALVAFSVLAPSIAAVRTSRASIAASSLPSFVRLVTSNCNCSTCTARISSLRSRKSVAWTISAVSNFFRKFAMSGSSVAISDFRSGVAWNDSSSLLTARVASRSPLRCLVACSFDSALRYLPPSVATRSVKRSAATATDFSCSIWSFRTGSPS